MLGVFLRLFGCMSVSVQDKSKSRRWILISMKLAFPVVVIAIWGIVTSEQLNLSHLYIGVGSYKVSLPCALGFEVTFIHMPNPHNVTNRPRAVLMIVQGQS